MTLEDFFTLTEIKDGLTAPSRVHELIAVMQKEKECAVKNGGDATRQWAAVASTIAATDNEDCLDLFIKLDGLWFVDRWLKDAQQFDTETTDGFVEESLTALLRAVEKLQIDKERSVSSGIWVTVNKLLDHSSSHVQDRASALFDRWKEDSNNDTIHHHVNSIGAFHDTIVHSSDDNREQSADVQNNPPDLVRDKCPLSSSNSLQSERVEDVQVQTQGNLEDKSPDPLTTSVLSDSVQESPPLKEKFLSNTVEGDVLIETHNIPASIEENVDRKLDLTKMNNSFSGNSSMIAPPSSKVKPGVDSSSVDAATANEDAAKPGFRKNISAEGSNIDTSDDAAASIPPTNSTPDDVGAIHQCSSSTLKPSTKDGCSPNTVQHSSDSDGKLEKPEDLGTPFLRMDDSGVADDHGEHSSDEVGDLRDDSDFSRPAMDTQRLVPVNKSDMDLEYGMDDALMFARQVAQEVKREVGDSREPSCSSSSEKLLETDTVHPDSLDSLNARQGPSKDVPPGDVPTRRLNRSVEVCPEEEEGHLISLNNVNAEAGNGVQDLESSQVTEVAAEPEVNTDKSLCDFDLNQEICSDDVDHPTNTTSAPVSVVSASRPAVASESPSAPLQFEGILGWKGSAATSAFRPASSRRTFDGDKTLETRGTDSLSKHRQDSLVIDLNVAEDGDEKADIISGRPIPVSSSLQSAESSLEIGTRTSERPNLDLNRMGDDGDAASGFRMDRQLFYLGNGNRSPSPASSSSSMRPSLRNFDLNDRPLLPNDSLDHHGIYLNNHSGNAFGGSKLGDPVISIMGTRVEVGGGGRVEIGRRDFIPQNPSAPNGKPLDLGMNANVARMGGVMGIPTVSYAHSPVLGYNGLTTAPPTMSISSAVYGLGAPLPFMVDTRGGPVMPQFLGSAPAIQPFSQPSSFSMSMGGPPVSLNGAGPSRHNLDLNSGFALEAGNPGGLRQVFMSGQGRSMDENLRAQPSSSSGLGLKRKEPDGGWEAYALPYKHPQSPWG